MSGTTIFLALCLAGLPFLVYVLISLHQDGKRKCRSTCRLTKMNETLVPLEIPLECVEVSAGEDNDDEGQLLVEAR